MSIIEDESIQKYCSGLKLGSRKPYTDEHAAYLLKNIEDIKYIVKKMPKGEQNVENVIDKIAQISGNKVDIPLCLESVLFFRKHGIYTRKHGYVCDPLESFLLPLTVVTLIIGIIIVTPIVLIVDYEADLIKSYAFAYIPALLFAISNYCKDAEKREQIEKDFK